MGGGGGGPGRQRSPGPLCHGLRRRAARGGRGGTGAGTAFGGHRCSGHHPGDRPGGRRHRPRCPDRRGGHRRGALRWSRRHDLGGRGDRRRGPPVGDARRPGGCGARCRSGGTDHRRPCRRSGPLAPGRPPAGALPGRGLRRRHPRTPHAQRLRGGQGRGGRPGPRTGRRAGRDRGDRQRHQSRVDRHRHAGRERPALRPRRIRTPLPTSSPSGASSPPRRWRGHWYGWPGPRAPRSPGR